MSNGITPHDVRRSGANNYSGWLQLLDDDALADWLSALEQAAAEEPTDAQIAAVLSVYAALRTLEAGSPLVLRAIDPGTLHEMPEHLLALAFFERMRRAGMMAYEPFTTNTAADSVAYTPSPELSRWAQEQPGSPLADWLAEHRRA